MKIKILIPIFNDWQSVFKLLDEINNLSLDREFQLSIIILNDASNFDHPDIDKSFEISEPDSLLLKISFIILLYSVLRFIISLSV